MKHFAIIFSAAMAFLCTTSCQIAYVEPTDSNVAYLNVPEVKGQVLGVATFREAEYCKGQTILRGIGVQDPDNPAVSTSFVKISAGVPRAFRVTLYNGITECSFLISFVPQAGRYYRLQITRNFAARSCYLTAISSDAPSMVGAREEPFRRLHELTRVSSQEGPWCTPE